MATVGLMVHDLRPEPASLARDLTSWLCGNGHDVRLPKPDAELAKLGEWACDPESVGEGLDLAVSLGGDGTMLRTIRTVAPYGVPVLGVNMGRLGYLSQVEPGEAREAIERFLLGDYVVEERMTLSVDVQLQTSGDLDSGCRWGMNEAVVERPASGHTVHLAVSISGRFFTTYAADGLIVASPTGSTAYSFSARGPILSPGHRAMVLTPLSPHMLFDRSLVLGPTESIRIEVADSRPAVLTIDGQAIGSLRKGDAIECQAAPHQARLITFEARDFWRVLKTKFGLADR